MSDTRRTPFDTIEGAQEYVGLLAAALEEAITAIEQDIVVAGRIKGAQRRLEALQLVSYKLHQLRGNLTSSLRILNNLRTLRRLLLGEREGLGGSGLV